MYIFACWYFKFGSLKPNKRQKHHTFNFWDSRKHVFNSLFNFTFKYLDARLYGTMLVIRLETLLDPHWSLLIWNSRSGSDFWLFGALDPDPIFKIKLGKILNKSITVRTSEVQLKMYSYREKLNEWLTLHKIINWRKRKTENIIKLIVKIYWPKLCARFYEQ